MLTCRLSRDISCHDPNSVTELFSSLRLTVRKTVAGACRGRTTMESLDSLESWALGLRHLATLETPPLPEALFPGEHLHARLNVAQTDI